MAFDATVGGAAATSYVAVAAALSYFEDRLHAEAFQDAGPGKQEDALVMATRRLEQLGYLGRRSTSTQRLAWPRAGIRNSEGCWLDSTTIPEQLTAATCELALALLQADPDEEFAGDGLGGVTSLSLGPLSFSRQEGGTADKDLPKRVKQNLAGLVSAMGSTFRISR